MKWEPYIYTSDYSGRLRICLRKRAPWSSTGWRYARSTDQPMGGSYRSVTR